MNEINLDLDALQPGIYLENEGGYYVERIKYPDGSIWALVLAPKNAEVERQWKTADTSTTGTDSVFDGFSNSNNMNNSTHPAALYCRSYTGGGKTDWYLASKDEWEIIYRHLKPDTNSNDTGSGANTHAYPTPTSNYTSSNPAQTSNLMFRGGTNQSLVINNWYWTSTQYSSSSAWLQGTNSGGQYGYYKATAGCVRPVRKIRIA